MTFIQSALTFLALMIVFHLAFSKHDKRWSGVRLAFKGSILLGIGVLFAGLSDLSKEPFIQTLKIFSLLISLTGIVIGFWGITRHWKIMFSPTDQKREIDPGYDLEYVLCSHCKGSSIRIDAKPLKCPICKKRPNRN